MGFANPLPWWALVLVTAAAAALAWHAYRRFAAWPLRRDALAALRFVTLMVLVLVLMRPVTRSTEGDARDVVVPILVDASRSMAIEDVDGRRRIDAARELLEREVLPVLSGRFTVEMLTFGEKLEPARGVGALTATERRTDLAGALAAARERYRGRPVAGYVLLTDGGDTGAVLDLDAYAETLPPIYPVPLGSTSADGDREVLSVTAAESVLDGSRIELAVSAVARGETSGTLELRLLENGRPLQVRHVRTPHDGGPFREIFQVSPSTGTATVYTVEIPSVPGEIVPENNTRSVLVQPPSRARRVLVVEGAPGFEHSFLRRALAADRDIEIDFVVRKGKDERGTDTFYIQAGAGRGEALTSGYPREPAALFQYDAVILANVGSDQLTSAQMEATREFVRRRGGGVLVFGAQSFLARGLAGTPIEEVLPVELGRRVDTLVQAGSTGGINRVSVTDAGLSHPITQLAETPEETRKRWAGLPALAGAASPGSIRAGASILATTVGSGGAARPLIAVQRYGEGRSMVFTGEASWRWRMLLPSIDRTYETFWRQTVRWLAIGATDPVTVFPMSSVGPGDELTVRAAVRDPSFAAVRDADVDVRIAGPDGRLQELRAAPGSAEARDSALFTARFIPDQPGLYRVTVSGRRGGAPLGTAATSALVGGADAEMADPRVSTAFLERIATATGGRVVRAGESPALADLLRTAAPAAALAVQRDLWHNAWSLLFIIALLAAEWVLRRRWGLR